jgi:hypothetical protein
MWKQAHLYYWLLRKYDDKNYKRKKYPMTQVSFYLSAYNQKFCHIVPLVTFWKHNWKVRTEHCICHPQITQSFTLCFPMTMTTTEYFPLLIFQSANVSSFRFTPFLLIWDRKSHHQQVTVEYSVIPLCGHTYKHHKKISGCLQMQT